MDCEVCDTDSPSRYKCPKCFIRYCSLPCWKLHKEEGCEPVEEDRQEIKQGEEVIQKHRTDSTIPHDRLKELEKSEELKGILRNPHVRNILTAIDRSENPTAAMQNAMLEPIFVEFADACLKVVSPNDDEDVG